MRTKVRITKLVVVIVGIFLLTPSCATSRIKYPMQRAYSPSGGSSVVYDAPHPSHKTEEQRVKGAFGQ